MYGKIQKDLQKAIEELKDKGLYKVERVITSSQDANIEVEGGKEVINFCANNYLGLANNSEIVGAAQEAMDKWGFGLSSVRFICGTQQIHKQLEHVISDFLGMEDTILYCAAFDANGGVFEPLL
ncbi:MAG TPA: aminotransferase class I/II-fold pyridoxal phosphate-dependent enzyme, partial [Prolixibacteraceae bacterium]|nr:aminotransferase class I/II-fold pyridoxal phosphate-dependent enzyme [Prolixibacteraceae bacterium]